MPIHFMHKSLAFDELCALYAVSDVCLVSSTRDGMNLVSKNASFSRKVFTHVGYKFRCPTNTLHASKNGRVLSLFPSLPALLKV